MPRGKFITLDAHIRYEEVSQVHNLSSYIKKLGKKKQTKYWKFAEKRSNKEQRLMALKIGKQHRKSMKPKAGFFEKN